MRPVIAVGVSLAAMFAVTSRAPGASARCTIIFSFDWFRHDTATYVIAVARADSAIGAYWVRPGHWDSIPAPQTEEQRRNWEAMPRTGPVYGQWADIMESGDTAVSDRGLFINWGTGSLCENMPSGKARWIESGTPFFLEARPRFDTLAPRGIPVFDITGVTNVYDPVWWQRFDSTGRVLTVDEYARFYRALPLRSEWFADPARAAVKLRAWARANPEIARRLPVRDILQEMEGDLEIRLEDMRRPPQ